VTRRGPTGGFTIVELVIASFLALVVVLALGTVAVTSNRSWDRHLKKATLQANTTEALEWMARAVRGARTIAVVDTSQVRTYDASGTLTHTYQRVVLGDGGHLRQDGTDLVEQKCTRFRVTPDDDTTSVTLLLELEDRSESRMKAETRVAVRNRTFTF